MSGQVVPLPDGCLGFDANCVIDAEGARAWYERGFRVVYRYVRRDQTHRFDLSRDEVQILHDAGLCVGIVQHATLLPALVVALALIIVLRVARGERIG